MCCTSFLRSFMRGERPKLSRLQFPTTGFEIVDGSRLLEEECFEKFSEGRYYPVNIGEVLSSRYQVVEKLGFGTTSTVWLARDLKAHKHVTLKVYIRDDSNDAEIEMYKYLKGCSTTHPGQTYIRTALDVFTIPRAGGSHECIVQKPLWDSFKDLLSRNPTHRFSEDLLKAGLRCTLLALDYLHTECGIIHTDIKADSILVDIEDETLYTDFETAELETPSPRKLINGAPIYASRRFGMPHTLGQPVLSDFGSAVRGNVEYKQDVQPNIYRAPEVIIGASWSYPIDIWNLGCMVWDVFEGKHLFTGKDPKITADFNPNGDGYTTRAHLAEVVKILGFPPKDLLSRGRRSWEFFTEDGEWCSEIDIPHDQSLESSEENLEGENKRQFLVMMRSMLQWRPEDRKTAKQVLDDSWLNENE